MYYPHAILSQYYIHGYNHETILFFSYFSAKYAYLAMHIKKMASIDCLPSVRRGREARTPVFGFGDQRSTTELFLCGLRARS